MPKPIRREPKCIACGDTGLNSKGGDCICRSAHGKEKLRATNESRVAKKKKASRPTKKT